MEPSWQDTFELTLVRHGETDYNLSPVLKSETDSPLNSTGRKQATLIAQRLKTTKFHQIFTSDLKRAGETAKAIHDTLEFKVPKDVAVDPRIRERDLQIGSSQENTSVAHWIKVAVNWSIKENRPFFHFNPPGDGCGESHEECTKRAADFFEDLCFKACSDSESRSVLVVSHGLWILSLIDHLLTNSAYEFEQSGSVENLSKSLYRTDIKNTAVTKLRFSCQVGDSGKRKFQVTMFNDATHLQAESNGLLSDNYELLLEQ